VSILRSGFGALRLDPYALTTGKDKSLATAALSIAIVKESSASLLFRPVVNDTGSNDGMLHALVLAPRSRMELLRFLLAALFLGSGPRKKLPPFMGHIKTAALNVTSPRPLDYWHDGAWIALPVWSSDHRGRAIDERSIINNRSWRGLRCSSQLP